MDLTAIARKFVRDNTVAGEGQFWLSEIEWAKLIDEVEVQGEALHLNCRDDVPRWRELATHAGKQIRSFLTVAPPKELRHLKVVKAFDRSQNLVAEWPIGVLPDGTPWTPKV